MKEARPIPNKGTEKRLIRGQTTYISGRSPLRCYYYGKLGPKWNSADRVVFGMRWNAYLSSGKATPFFRPLEPDTLPHSSPKMRSISAEKENAAARKKDEGIGSGPSTKRSRKEGARRSEERTGSRSYGATSPAVTSTNATDAPPGVFSISNHPRFRHLRVVPSTSTGIAAAQVISIGVKAHKMAGSPARPEHRVPAASAHVPLTVPPQSFNQSAPAQEGIPASAHHENGYAAEFMPTIRISASQDTIREPRARPSGAPAKKTTRTAQAAVPVQSFSFNLRVPENDNARPGGYDDPQRMPAPGGIPQVFFCASPAPAGKGIGYISSPQKKVAQLKLASGAASMPQ